MIRARKTALRDENALFRSAKAPLHSQLGLLHGQRVLWKEWSDGSDDRYEEGLVAVYLTAGRGLIPRRGDWLPGTPWDMSDLAPLSVAERCEPAPEDATFTHVCG